VRVPPREVARAANVPTRISIRSDRGRDGWAQQRGPLTRYVGNQFSTIIG